MSELETSKDRTAWFRDCGWGIFCHYLPDAAGDGSSGAAMTSAEWNAQVDAFDVKGLADQLQSVHAPYFFITIGQNSGHYLAPNTTYDDISIP